MAEIIRLRVWGTVVDSWRFLLLRPWATLLTMVLAALCLRVVLGAATFLSITPAPDVPVSPDGYTTPLFPLAVSGIFALSGRLAVAALVMVLWHRAVIRIPAIAGWTYAGTLARAVARSALLLAALGGLWAASALLMLFPLGARPGIMVVSEMPVRMIGSGDTDWLFDPRMLVLSGILVVAALVPIRLALGLPAVALGRAFNVRSAWSLGRGNSWRLLAALLLALLPVWLAGYAMDPPYVPRVDRDWLWWSRNEIDTALNGLLSALAGIVLAGCYRSLGGCEPPGRKVAGHDG